jgi:hypothetical protein
MRLTDEYTYGINWDAANLEEGWEEIDEDGTTPELFSSKNRPVRCFQTSWCLERDHDRETEADMRKVTVYLPYALFRKMHQYKKRKRIRSYSEAIANALTSYLE